MAKSMKKMSSKTSNMDMMESMPKKGKKAMGTKKPTTKNKKMPADMLY